MNSRFKEFAGTPKGKLVIAVCAMLVSWIFLLWNFSGSISFSLPSDKRKSTVKQEIRRLRSELQSLDTKFKDADKIRKRFKTLTESSWQPDRDGDPELILRQKIENAAKECELKLNSIGTVRTTRITQDFYFAELDISANASFETIIKFIAKIQEQKPVISWRRLSAFLMFQRPRTNTQSRTVTNNSSGNTSETTLIFSGNLRVVVYEEGTSGQKEVQKNTKSSVSTGTSASPQPQGRTGGPGEAGGPPPEPMNAANGPPPPPPSGEGAPR